ncbi:hypothetical protein BSR02_07685 [Serratia liquefaciens]|nr:hypothetical protein M495_01310 [Serratia liquefaciens ATCC 27592]RYM69909.1 hypothetical protein BSQ99_15805 [Serratia liquefaciens]RYM85908.1 hypothetical protein BSR02_07685 [Serratia liquefaciens]
MCQCTPILFARSGCVYANKAQVNAEEGLARFTCFTYLKERDEASFLRPDKDRMQPVLMIYPKYTHHDGNNGYWQFIADQLKP